MDVLALGVGTKAEGGRADEGANVVGRLDTVASGPRDVVLVGEDGGRERGAVVTTPADEHETAAGKSGERDVSGEVDGTKRQRARTQSWGPCGQS